MEKNVITRIDICGSLYSLLLYLLTTNIKEISETYFFFSYSIPSEVSKHFQNLYIAKKYKNKLFEAIYYSFIKYFKYIRWPFLRHAEIYGADHLKLAFSLVGSRKITVIEDGVMTYKNIPISRNSFFYKIVFGPLATTKYFGQHNQANKIILTGILPYKNNFHIPIQYININNLWKCSSIEKQNFIKKIYNITNDDILIMKGRTEIIFTQPLSEDNIITESEKITIYKKLLKNTNYNNIIFRPHPRETTDYSKYFPNCYIYNKKLPFELLCLCGISFDKAYTIFSTIVYTLPKHTKIIFGGTKMHPNLVKKFGIIEYKPH